jgi:hypothetical protein
LSLNYFRFTFENMWIIIGTFVDLNTLSIFIYKTIFREDRGLEHERYSSVCVCALRFVNQNSLIHACIPESFEKNTSNLMFKRKRKWKMRSFLFKEIHWNFVWIYWWRWSSSSYSSCVFGSALVLERSRRFFC